MSVSLGYDSLHRLTQVQGSATTRFIYDGSTLSEEMDTSGDVLARYVPGPDGTPLLWYNGSGTSDRRWLLKDQQGSVIAVANGSGGTLAINTYDAYGLPGGSNLGRIQYTGQSWISEDGLYDYRARTYSPTLGRFLQTDPIGYGDGMNWYAYTHGDPVNGTDPSGLDTPCTGGSCPTVVVTAPPGGGGGQIYGGQVAIGPLNERNMGLGGGGGASKQPQTTVSTVTVTAHRRFPYGTVALIGLGILVDILIPEIAIPAELAEGAALLSKVCFAAGTLVVTSHGLVPIEKIKPGEMVLSRDPVTGATGYKRVLAVKTPSENDIYRVTVDVSDRRHHLHHHAQFKVTAEHPWRETDGRWVATKDLHRGDSLVSEFGRAIRVSAVVDQHREVPTYNLEVADYHTYFVGRDRVWVHNACFAAKVLEAIKEEAFSEGTLGELEGPYNMANPDPALGPNQVRY